MLRHFEHIDLTPLLVDLDRLHIFLVDRLDRHFLPRLGVRRQLDETELAFAEIVLKVVVVKQVRVSDDLPKAEQPVLLLSLAFEVQDARLVRRQDDLNWVELAAFGLALLGWHFLDEGADQGVLR